MEKETLIDKLGRLISLAGTAIVMNLMFLACCLPVVTIGQAWCGLMSAIRYNIRGEKWFPGFMKGFKTRFWRGVIAWSVMLAIMVVLIVDIGQYFATNVSTVYPVASCVMFALMAMMAMALMVLNVYIPTKAGTWVSNASKLVFRAPLELLGCALAVWLPVFLILFLPELAYYLIMIFIVAYFTLVALATTLLLKNALVEFLLEARVEGTLLEDEGKRVDKED